MIDQNTFPPGIATNNAFCNRTKERKYLKQCIENNEHVVLISARRYGKTSLIAQVILDTGRPSIAIDLLICPTDEHVKKHILRGISQLCSKLAKNNSIRSKIVAIMEKFNPKVTLSA